MTIRHSVGVALKRVLYEGFGRDRWQRPDRVISALGLRPGMVVADLGSGTGYFTLRFARAVGPSGRVFAVDTDRQLLQAIGQRARETGLNVETVEASEDGPRLPGAVDLVFLSNVYHHLPAQTRYFAALRSQLAADGRVAIIESVAQGLFRRLFGHATDPAVIRAAMGEAGYELVATHEFVANHSFQVFRQAPSDQALSDGT